MKFEDYKTCLLTNKEHIVHDIHSFRSCKLIMETIKQDKKAFDNSDDKRVPILGSYKAFAHGHHETC